MRAICTEGRCTWKGDITEALYAPNPFDESDTLTGCPLCKAINTLAMACDEPDCWFEATCGTNTPGGYRVTCGKHAPLSSVAVGQAEGV